MIHALVLLLVFSTFLSPLCGAQLHHHPQKQKLDANSDGDELINIIHIGLIVDMESSVGKVVLSCVNMAIYDAKAFDRQNGTRIALHTRDSEGEPLTAITAAEDLLKNIKMDAIIVPEMTNEASMMATLGDKANVPVLSFTSIPLSTAHPYFLQIIEEENSQFQGIIALLETFKWRNAILIHEDTDDGRNILPQILEEFQERNIHVMYKNTMSLFGKGDDQIVEEFQKLKMMQASVFVVHTSPSLASKIFINAKRLSMMSEGYAWLITSKTMNFLDSFDPLVIQSMQGALGLKSYIPTSSKFQNFTLRWRKEVQLVEPDQELRDLNVLGIRAYDTIWALANTSASLGTKSNRSGSQFLSEISRSEFRGLGGDFQFINGELVSGGYEVVNVIENKGQKSVGFWTLANGFTKEISLDNGDGSPNLGLNAIIWPGLSTTTPIAKRLKIGFPAYGFKEFIGMERDIQNNLNVTGFCKDVFDAAIETLGYPIPYDLIPYADGNGPSQGSYTDLTYQVYLKKYDAAIGDITITFNRSLYVDFTLPFTDLGVGTTVNLNKQSRWFFLKPLDSDLWITVACSFILIGVIVWLLEHPTNEEFQGSRTQQIATILRFSISTLVYAHRERLRNNLSKFVVGVWLFVVFILASSYAAILSSILTVQQIQLAKGDYIGHVSGSYASRAIVNNNLNFGDDKLKPYGTLKDFNDALSRGSEHGGIGAIIDEIPYIKMFLSKYPSDHVMIETSSTTNGFGFAFQKGSPLVPEISRAIAKLRENGKLLELEKKWYNKRNTGSEVSSKDFGETKPNTLSLNNFVGLFFVSGLSKIIALLIFFIFFLREKLSLNHHILNIIVEGKLAFFMKYLSSRMYSTNAIGGTLPR